MSPGSESRDAVVATARGGAMIEPLAVATVGVLISLAAFWLEGALRWGALGLGGLFFVLGVAWLVAMLRRMARTAAAWQRR